jgi:hypothetical protein
MVLNRLSASCNVTLCEARGRQDSVMYNRKNRVEHNKYICVVAILFYLRTDRKRKT